MQTHELEKKTCVPCQGGVPALTQEEIDHLIKLVPGWSLRIVDDVPRIERTFELQDFAGSIRLVNRIAAVAEREGHHPDLHIHWNEVTVELWTHEIRGLHQNDFILAAKIDSLKPV